MSSDRKLAGAAFLTGDEKAENGEGAGAFVVCRKVLGAR